VEIIERPLIASRLKADPPDLQHLPQLLSYLGERNIAVFSTDIDSRDFKMHKPDEVIKSVMSHNWKSAARASSYA